MINDLGTHSETINQSYFLEATKGAGHPTNYLDRFPSELYNTSPDSVLYKLIYTLIGPAGIASLKQGYFEARLKFEEMGLELNELEKFYANPMGFGRIATETYSEDVVGLLNNDIWSKVKAADQAYKNRVLDFLHAARLGGTPDGIRYAAKSALGQDVEIIEGYQYLFDQHSDQMLDLDSTVPPSPSGTYSTEAFGILPNPEISKTVIQTISFDPIPNQGSFIIKYGSSLTPSISIEDTTSNFVIQNATADNYVYTYQTTTGHLIGKGATVYISGADISAYNGYFTVLSTTYNTFAVVGAKSFPGTPNFYDGKVTFDPKGTIVEDIRRSLVAIPSIKNNVKVSGNLENGFVIQFTGQLANQLDVGIITVDASSAYRFIDSENILPCSATVTSTSGAIPASEETAGLEPEVKHVLQSAVNQIKPVTSYPIVLDSASTWHHIQFDMGVKPIASSSEYSKVIRYVTGKNDVVWPSDPKNSLYWIVRDMEIEAPAGKSDFKETYQNFHQINTTSAYDKTNFLLSNQNYNIGRFDPSFVSAFPFLKQYDSDTTTKFSPNFAVADHTKPRTATAYDAGSGTPLIDGIYPSIYFNLKNVLKKSTNDMFWASVPKINGEYDYLEIDFGSTRAVNFISFEILKTPIGVTIEYDDLDYPGSKNWQPVTPETIPGSDENYSFSSDFTYSVGNQSPWDYATYSFRDANNNMIYTRYVRIKFSRKKASSLYIADFLKKPWSICVKNLRIGRNV
jgi:hypothetical protein